MRDYVMPPGVPEIEIGDLVLIVDSPETIAGGWAGREGTYYGFTTPSVTGIEGIGLADDLAVNVGFGDGVDQWFDPSLVRRLGFDPEGTMTVGDKHFVRDADGNWIPKPN